LFNWVICSAPLQNRCWQSLFIRHGFFSVGTVDRLGKGIRTGARDAILSAEATEATKARVFGFHVPWTRLGRSSALRLALVFLYFHPGAYQSLFLVALFPVALPLSLPYY